MGVEMPFEMVIENAPDAARNAAMGQPKILAGPLGKARIESQVMRGAGRAQPRVERLGVCGVRNCRVEVRAAPEPALRRRQEARIHMDRGNVWVGHMRDQTDARGKEGRILLGTGNRLGELLTETPADGRDVDPDLLEYLS